MPKIVAQENVFPLQQQLNQEIDLSQVNKDQNVLETGTGYGENAPVKPKSIWTNLMCCFKKGSLSRVEKKAQKKEKKEQKILKKKEKDQEVAQKEWSQYTKVEKTRFIGFTILKVSIFYKYFFGITF